MSQQSQHCPNRLIAVSFIGDFKVHFRPVAPAELLPLGTHRGTGVPGTFLKHGKIERIYNLQGILYEL